MSREQGRLAVLQICTKGVPLHQDVCLQDLAAQTERFSGADLENLCKEVKLILTVRTSFISFLSCSRIIRTLLCLSQAALLALREEGLDVSCVRQKYFLKALQALSPSLSPEQHKQHFHSCLY